LSSAVGYTGIVHEITTPGRRALIQKTTGTFRDPREHGSARRVS
jgi:hypothetical protein